MTTYYVSSAATNGYVVGNDANDGLSKATPLRSLNPINGAGWTWSGDDTVYVNGDTYCGTTFYVDDDITFIGETGSGAGGANPTIVFASNGAQSNGVGFKTGFVLRFEDLILDGTECLFALFRGDLLTPQKGELELVRCRVLFKQYGVYTLEGMPLTITDCSAYHRTGTGGFVYMTGCDTGDDVTVDSVALDLNGSYANGFGGIVLAATTGQSPAADIAGVTGLVVSDVASPGYVMGVYVKNFPSCAIHDCDATVRNTASGGYATLYTITNPNNAGTAISIYDNRGQCDAPNGVSLSSGHDNFGDGADDAEIYNNDIRGNSAPSGLHGICIFGAADCNVYNNRMRNAAIGFLYKGTTRGICHHNVAEFITQSSAYMMKGCTDSQMVANACIMASGSPAPFFYAVVNVAVDNSGCLFDGNFLYVYPGVTLPTYVVQLADASQDVTFHGNNYYGPSVTWGDRWHNGTAAGSFATWNALANVFNDTQFPARQHPLRRMDNRLLISTYYW